MLRISRTTPCSTSLAVVVITNNLFGCSDFDHIVAQLVVDAVVASNFVKVDDVLEVPTHQHIDFCKRRHCDVLAIGPAGLPNYFG